MSTPEDPPQRRRLEVDERRVELLEVGVRLLAAHPYDELTIAAVARAASASTGLIYHYFGNKRGFFLAVVEREAGKLAAATVLRPNLDPRDRLLASLDGYFDYVESNPAGYKALHRGTLGADSAVRAIMDGNLRLQRDRIVEAVASEPLAHPLLIPAVRGWLAFLVSACIAWLDEPDAPRDQLRDLCSGVLEDAISRALSD